MGRERLPRDDRGVSESAGVAVLVAITVLVTASVGISVLFIPSEEERGVNAEFTFEHFQDSGQLLITHRSGDPVPAGDLLISGEVRNKTWATIANVSEDEPVEPNDAIQLSDTSRWGQEIRRTSRITLYYVPNATGAKVLGGWNRGPGSGSGG